MMEFISSVLLTHFLPNALFVLQIKWPVIKEL